MRSLTSPCPYGIPEASAYPMAAGVPDSGTGITRSASEGNSRASVRPTSTRTECNRRPEIMGVRPGQVHVLEQAVLGSALAKVRLRRPLASTAISSLGVISRMNVALTMSSAAVSLATTQLAFQPAKHQRPDAPRGPARRTESPHP